MARPYGLTQVGGEGTYGGLRGLVATPDVINTGANGFGQFRPGTAGSPYYGPVQDMNVPVPDVTGQQISILWDQVFGAVNSASEVPESIVGTQQSIGDWVKANTTLLLVGGIVGLLLFRRN